MRAAAGSRSPFAYQTGSGTQGVTAPKQASLGGEARAWEAPGAARCCASRPADVHALAGTSLCLVAPHRSSVQGAGQGAARRLLVAAGMGAPSCRRRLCRRAHFEQLAPLRGAALERAPIDCKPARPD